MKLLNKKLGILGMGREGASLKNFLLKRNIKDLDCYDDNREEFKNISEIDSRDVLVRSPGVNSNIKYIRMFDGKVISLSDLFLKLCPTKKVIGITGSQGKSIVSYLSYKIFQESNDNVFMVGNNNDTFFNILPDIRTRDIVLLELSHAYLQECVFSPNISVITRLNSDHLNTYDSMDKYIETKKNIFKNQKNNSKVGFCYDCEISREIAKNIQNDREVFGFSLKKELDRGVFLRSNKIIWKNKAKEEEVLDVNLISDKSASNLENFLSAILITKLLNSENKNIEFVVKKDFKLPYRNEINSFIKDKNLTFYNNGCSTNPFSTLEIVKNVKKNTILVLGGKDKKSDYTELLDEIRSNKHITKTLVFGEINKIFTGENIYNFNNLKDLLFKISDYIYENQDIIFSPSAGISECFKNNEERAEFWNLEIEKLFL